MGWKGRRSAITSITTHWCSKIITDSTKKCCLDASVDPKRNPTIERGKDSWQGLQQVAEVQPHLKTFPQHMCKNFVMSVLGKQL